MLVISDLLLSFCFLSVRESIAGFFRDSHGMFSGSIVEEAKQNCIDMGGHLVTITSSQEQASSQGQL